MTTTRQDSIKELLKAGKRGDVMDVFTRHGQTAQQAYERIRADTTITEAHRTTLLAQTQRQVQRAADAELERAARSVVRVDHDDAASVFGTKGLAGDSASLTIARRDAGDRVAKITDKQELADLLRRATRTGDELLARAVAERATEMQNADVMNQFLADRPQLEQAGERLWNVEQAERPSFDVGMLGASHSLRASELDGYSSDQVEGFADGNSPETSGRAPMFDSTTVTTRGGQSTASATAFL